MFISLRDNFNLGVHYTWHTPIFSRGASENVAYIIYIGVYVEII